MTGFDRGDVVLVPFPFTDQSGSKRRPAVVLSTSTYNRRRADLIVAPITGNITTGQPDDTNVQDWSSAGLLKPSVVKGILGTVEHTLVIRVMGKFSNMDLQRVEKTFADALGLVVGPPPPATAATP